MLKLTKRGIQRVERFVEEQNAAGGTVELTSVEEVERELSRNEPDTGIFFLMSFSHSDLSIAVDDITLCYGEDYVDGTIKAADGTEIELSRCPVCGDLPYVHGKPAMDFKFFCCEGGTHVSCGDWYLTVEQAAKSWNERCKGIGQPEYYCPSNMEWLKARFEKMSTEDVAELLCGGKAGLDAFLERAAGGKYPQIEDYSEAVSWLNAMHRSPECARCGKCPDDTKWCACEIKRKER